MKKLWQALINYILGWFRPRDCYGNDKSGSITSEPNRHKGPSLQSYFEELGEWEEMEDLAQKKIINAPEYNVKESELLDKELDTITDGESETIYNCKICYLPLTVAELSLVRADCNTHVHYECLYR